MIFEESVVCSPVPTCHWLILIQFLHSKLSVSSSLPAKLFLAQTSSNDTLPSCRFRPGTAESQTVYVKVL